MIKIDKPAEQNGWPIDFYKEALGLELTWLRDRTEPYDLGDNEIHLAMHVDDFESALKKHREIGCVCYENKDMGIYFIEDPDGY